MIWIFCVMGFFSVACASNPDGSIDPNTVMIRARKIDHLRNLKARFPELAGANIIRLSNRDYRFRVIIPKRTWLTILTMMAEEMEWSNFKDEAARYQGRKGASYVAALHDVWGRMHRLQDS